MPDPALPWVWNGLSISGSCCSVDASGSYVATVDEANQCRIWCLDSQPTLIASFSPFSVGSSAVGGGFGAVKGTTKCLQLCWSDDSRHVCCLFESLKVAESASTMNLIAWDLLDGVLYWQLTVPFKVDSTKFLRGSMEQITLLSDTRGIILVDITAQICYQVVGQSGLSRMVRRITEAAVFVVNCIFVVGFGGNRWSRRISRISSRRRS
jgi:hypothetical protein